jgi:epoxyqueuosine reductase QueG
LCQAPEGPFRQKAPVTFSAEPGLRPAAGMNPVELAEVLALDEEGFRRRFGRSVLLRAGWAGILRNARTVLENQAAQ